MLIGGRTFDQRRRKTDEGHICYYVSGSSSPVLVAVPGSFGDAGSLGEVIGRLDPDLSLLIVELRGHGNSSPPPRNGSIEQFATDVLDVCCVEGLKDFYVTGPSIGGMVALEMGSQRPHLVKGIIAIEGWTRSEVQQQAFDGLKVNTLTEEQLEERRKIRKRQVEGWTESEIREFVKIWTRWDGYGFLCQTDIPILEIWGDRGRARPTLDQMRIPRRENIEIHWVRDASHVLCYERPAEVAESIMGFIRTREIKGI